MSGRRIGFLVNPIAGMGGRVGLKGTDHVADQAAALGAQPGAHLKAATALRRLTELLAQSTGSAVAAPEWLTCAGCMGADALRAADIGTFQIVYQPGQTTSERDTRLATRRFIDHGAELILFSGGDGTARDICRVTRQQIPILGIPAGVKMYSGIFGINPARTAEILLRFLRHELSVDQVEVIDLDEAKYRQGEWSVKLYDVALVPLEPSFTQTSKALISELPESQSKIEIAAYMCERMATESAALFLLGPGSTVAAIGSQLGIDKTLLGVDAVSGGKLVGKDLNEARLLDLLAGYRQRYLVVSPIGAQGFVLGRGNQQISPAVLKRIGPANVKVIATPGKLARTPLLRVDTGDDGLDQAFAGRGFYPVIIGFRQRRLVKILI